MTITSKDILTANKYGINNSEDMILSETPILETAAMLGQKGIDLSKCEIVNGYRFGKANLTGTSFNFREETRESGLSMAKIDNEDENYSSVYFNGEKCEYEGILLEERGSDGEALIIPFGADFENYGF